MRKVLAAFTLAALLAVGNVLIVRSLLRESDGIAATVNVAGKMRMLSQRIALDALAERLAPDAPRPDPYQLEILFEQAYDALDAGGSVFGLTIPAVDGQRRVRLAAVGRDWQSYRKTIQEFGQPVDAAGARAAAGYSAQDPARVLAASDQLLGSAEGLLDEVVLHARNVQQHALMSTYALFALDLLLLLLAYGMVSGLVLRPVRRLMGQCREMAAGNYGARSGLRSTDELGQLGRSLDDSAAHIEQLLADVDRERVQLKQVEAMFEGLADNTVAGIYMLDGAFNLTYANEQLARIMGYDRAEMTRGFGLARLFPPLTFEAVASQIRRRFEGQDKGTRYECAAVRSDGTPLEVEIFGSAMTLRGEPATIGIMLDISERKRAESSARRASLVYEHTSEAMVVTDGEGLIQDINPAFTAVTGYHAAEVIGQRMNLLSSGHQDQDFYQAMWSSLTETGRWSGDIWNRRKSGEEYIERLTINTSYNEDGSVACRIGLFSDVTEKRRREASIWRQAHYDHLTQLPNRQMFHENLHRSIDESRESGLPFALVFLDLDLFKEVNDTFGHDEGDELLRLVSRRLLSCVRGSDLVARLGGDEFTLIVRGLKRLDDIQPICQKVLQAVAQPYVLDSNTVHISASVGVTFFPRDGASATELLKHADLAMYAAKEKGRNQYCVFSADMQESAQMRRKLLHDLQQALDVGEFVLYYQPIVDLRSGRMVKAEALIRWRHPERGLVSPAEFIPLAEDTGLIVPIGDWAFHEAARQVKTWREELEPDFEIGINVSPVQFQSDGLDPQAWIQTLATLGLPGSAVSVEITERLLMDTEDDSSARLLAFRDAGIQVALDDFGTGYSSLSYLKRFDVDFLKIDQSFVSHLAQDSEDMVLCRAIILMAHQLGMKVIAEGIETQEQHELLLEAGCDFGQGFWYSRPLPAEHLTARLQEALQAG
ncbi:EAL domain-containing protein [Castellaniella sp. MT123]|uniref:EAL domain-containing protein n=1 Tax=Castellaniella sp. MT123 TaxID=3140381 RepID=UPI0031F3587E